MYFTVVEDRYGYFIYTGMSASKKDGLLNRAKEAFPQYGNLKVIVKHGEEQNKKFESELIF